MDHLNNLEEALVRFWGQDPIVLGDINLGLYEAQNPCSQIFPKLLTKFGLIDLMHHLRQRLHFCHLKTWTQVCQGTVLRES